jgi:hypothetical protein
MINKCKSRLSQCPEDTKQLEDSNNHLTLKIYKYSIQLNLKNYEKKV